MKPLRTGCLWLVAALALVSLAIAELPAKTPADEADLSFAVCPIVYPLDQSPTDRGYHYLFYGNGFFINDKGDLLTAAHVLSQLSDMAPYVVLRLPMAPPRMVKATIIGVDREHDVAVLQVTPNPFEGRYQVRYLSLAEDRPSVPQSVVAVALRPSRLRDPHTFDAFAEDRPSGPLLAYEHSQLEKDSADTELLLFGHGVLLGDSGAPVVSAESRAVVGLVEGRWLRVDAASMAAAKAGGTGVGAAVPVSYAISLLEKKGVTWHEAEKQKTIPQGLKPGFTPSTYVGAEAPTP
jgi:hypothetical protein